MLGQALRLAFARVDLGAQRRQPLFGLGRRLSGRSHLALQTRTIVVQLLDVLAQARKPLLRAFERLPLFGDLALELLQAHLGGLGLLLSPGDRPLQALEPFREGGGALFGGLGPLHGLLAALDRLLQRRRRCLFLFPQARQRPSAVLYALFQRLRLFLPVAHLRPQRLQLLLSFLQLLRQRLQVPTPPLLVLP